jgi:hypothetical protein
MVNGTGQDRTRYEAIITFRKVLSLLYPVRTESNCERRIQESRISLYRQAAIFQHKPV